MLHRCNLSCVCLLLAACVLSGGGARAEVDQADLFDTGPKKAVDSQTHLKPGDPAPDFTLRAIVEGKPGSVTLSDYEGNTNVVLSFVPAAWTPVCSDQWPGYNIVRELFEDRNATLIGITVDNLPTLHAWTRRMDADHTLWFPVASDFYPHGEVAQSYGVLRSSGVTERAIFVIDTKGIIRYIDVHDINERPKLESIIRALDEIQ